MSRHLRLRLAVLTAVAAGAMLVPATAAVASDQAQASVPHAAASEKPGDKSAGAKMKEDAVQKAAAARKAEAAKKAGADTVPRGAVAAGEAQAGSSGVAPLAGTAAGALLLAGAGTFVLRRRATARANG
ncbi:sortase-dependent protein [Streptomyces sp. NPDC101062]|uniref:sortase-dependent protein n=1 Tax=unclassified Streptomyces TaxID=2593676 RepID=UPI00380DEA9D